jgi:hypothetical protein
MRQRVFTQRIQDKQDMILLESTVAGLLGGEHNKCYLIRSSEFVQLRLCALYDKGLRPLHVYGENLQISLDTDNVASVYLLSMSVDAEEILLGKRTEPDCEAEQAEPAGSWCIKDRKVSP